MNLFQRYVNELPEASRQCIVIDYLEFEKNGVIGDEPLRQHAERFMTQVGLTTQVVLVMEKLAFEVFRYYALEHLKEKL